MKQKQEFIVRAMGRSELDLAMNWAAQEGWNPGLNDASCFYPTDPGGFLIGVLHDRPIGCISAVSYGDRFGFIGFYIILPEHREHGYGSRLWKAAMARMEGHCIGLDGVIDQQANYTKAGFELAYRNIRYTCKAHSSTGISQAVRKLDKVPSHELCTFDRRFFPASREKFLWSWIVIPNSIGLAYNTGNGIEGYGVIRPCRQGYKIGPLFATNANVAECLFDALQAGVPEASPVYLDVPEVNEQALALAKRHKMDSVFETARMYRGNLPPIDTDGIFGVTTLELG